MHTHARARAYAHVCLHIRTHSRIHEHSRTHTHTQWADEFKDLTGQLVEALEQLHARETELAECAGLVTHYEGHLAVMRQQVGGCVCVCVCVCVCCRCML